jgi:DNA-binding response OmpR family regulator
MLSSAEIYWQLPTIPLRILLLDDDALFCVLMERTAIKTGLRLSACSDLESFQHSLETGIFDAIIIDYAMDHLTGMDVAESLGDLPVIVVSRTKNEKKNAKGRQRSGKNSVFISKAVGPQTILDAARALNLI